MSWAYAWALFKRDILLVIYYVWIRKSCTQTLNDDMHIYIYRSYQNTHKQWWNLSEWKQPHDYGGLKLNKYSASPSRRFKLKNIIDGKNSSQSKGRTLPPFNLRRSPVRWRLRRGKPPIVPLLSPGRMLHLGWGADHLLHPKSWPKVGWLLCWWRWLLHYANTQREIRRRQ